MPLADDQNMIQALTPKRSDPRRLPGLSITAPARIHSAWQPCLARPLASNSARLNFTLSPHNFHALVESCGHNRRGYIAWGIGDAIGHFPGHRSRLVAPPLLTGAALYARPGAEVVRASRPISPSE